LSLCLFASETAAGLGCFVQPVLVLRGGRRHFGGTDRAKAGGTVRIHTRERLDRFGRRGNRASSGRVRLSSKVSIAFGLLAFGLQRLRDGSNCHLGAYELRGTGDDPCHGALIPVQLFLVCAHLHRSIANLVGLPDRSLKEFALSGEFTQLALQHGDARLDIGAIS
jgi:hypothetical protein